jgi:hypothetical protein
MKTCANEIPTFEVFQMATDGWLKKKIFETVSKKVVYFHSSSKGR